MADEPITRLPTDADGSPAATDGRATIARLAEEMLPLLMERLTNSQLGELEVREDGWRIRLRRPLGADQPADPQSVTDHLGEGLGPPPALAQKSSRGTATSPAVGYFAPAATFEVGARVRSGDAIGHVDVLGVRHDVVSPIDGVLRSLEVEAGQAVEYGQPIARLERED